MKHLIRYSLAALVGVGFVVAAESSAHAYGWDTHARMTEVSVQMMQDANVTPSPVDLSVPSGIDATRWNLFISKLRAAKINLEKLRTGLPRNIPRTISEDSSKYPYQIAVKALPCPVPPNLTLNLDHPEALRIGTFANGPPGATGTFNLVANKTAGPCGLNISPDQAKSSLGEILAWHTGEIDEDIGDTQLWLKPTSAGGLGALADAGNKVWRNVVGAALLPVVCLWNAIFGDGCDIDDSFNAADNINPVQYAEGVIPGVKISRSGQYTGLWHFIDIDAGGGTYNSPRGMLYEDAGPAGTPGAVDIAIMGLGDLVGLSVEASASAGVSKYGGYDKNHRPNTTWQATTLGHVEFSPLNHLAQYGWDKYTNGGFSDAEGLGWPLHAIGDGVEPQHVAGTTSWGHRPLEDFADQHINSILPLSSSDSGNRRDILVAAFDYWDALENGKDVNNFIIDLAKEARAFSALHTLELYNDAASVLWHTVSEAAGIALYKPAQSTIQTLVKKGTAATLGFLTFASEKATDAGDAQEGFCAPGVFFKPGLGCGGMDADSVHPIDVGLCPTNTTCAVDVGGGCPAGQVQHPTPTGGTVCCASDVIVCGGVCCSPSDHSCDADGCSTFDPPR